MVNLVFNISQNTEKIFNERHQIVRLEGGACFLMGEGLKRDHHATFYPITIVGRMSKAIKTQ